MKEKATSNASSPKVSTFNDTSLSAQRKRLLGALKLAQGLGVSTLEARSVLNILAPAARVHELRWMYGYNILSKWINQTDERGRKHRIVRYVLVSGTWRAAA